MFLSISAYAATLVVAIAFILLMAAGRSPDVLKDLTLFKINVENLELPSGLGSSEILNGLQEVSGTDFTGGSAGARDLKLARTYKAHLYNVCTQGFDGSSVCGKFEVGWWFNPKKSLKLDNTALSEDYPDGFDSAVDSYKQASYFLGFGIILALSFVLLAFIFGGLSLRFKRLRVVPSVLSFIISVLLTAEAGLAFRIAKRLVKALEGSLDIGIKAEVGPVIYVLFAAMAISFVALGLHIVAWQRSSRGKKSTRAVRIKPKFMGPPSDPGMNVDMGYKNKARGFGKMVPWKRHKYVKVEEDQQRQMPIRMNDMPPGDETSLMRPNGAYE